MLIDRIVPTREKEQRKESEREVGGGGEKPTADRQRERGQARQRHWELYSVPHVTREQFLLLQLRVCSVFHGPAALGNLTNLLACFWQL